MKAISFAVAASILIFSPTAQSMYQQAPIPHGMYHHAPMPYDNPDQQMAVQFGPFQSHQGPTPSAPPAAPTLQDNIRRRSRLRNALQMQPQDADRVLIESIGGLHTTSTLSSKLAIALGCKLILDYYLTGDQLMDFDPSTVIHLVTDNVLVLSALGGALVLESRRKKAENELINLLNLLDRFEANVPAHTATVHTMHPSYKRLPCILTEDASEQNPPQDEETPLTPLQIEQSQRIALLRESGALTAKTSMWVIVALLFGTNALRDCLYYQGQGKIPLITTAVSGIGAIGSLLVADHCADERDEHEQKVNAYVQANEQDAE